MARIGILVGAITVLAAVGCSSGDDGTEANDAAGLEAAVREIGEHAVSGDWLALYDRLSERCREDLTRSDWAGLTYGSQQAMGDLGEDPTGGAVTQVRTRDVTDGRGEALLVIEVDGDALFDEQWDEYVYEDGAWRVVDCVGFDPAWDEGTLFVDPDDGDPFGEDGSTGTTYGGELRPAEEVAADDALAAATAIALGESGSLGDGLSVVVDDLGAGIADGSSVVTVQLRLENRSGGGRSVPDVYLTCARSTYPGSVVSAGPGLSVFEDYGEIPSRSFAEGELHLTLPGAGPWDDDGAPIGCDAPLRLWFDDYETGSSLVLEVPEAILDEVLAEEGTT